MLLTKFCRFKECLKTTNTQNADVAFHLRAIGQQLELLSRTYKDLKDEVNSIKQQNRGADRRGNTVRMAVRNVRSDFEEFVDENTDVGEDDYDFASAGQGIRSGPNRARRNVNFRGIGTYRCEPRDHMVTQPTSKDTNSRKAK